MPEYLSVDKEASDFFIEKRSKFIGYVKPVSTVEEASTFIDEIKSKHWDAKHNVYAYVLKDGNVRKYSDDGEPQGTAGVPVLDVLEKSSIQNVCVVVTRYFGGILLGGGGLVRAYSHAASIGLKAAGITKVTQCVECELTTDYNFYGRLPTLIDEAKGKAIDSTFEELVKTKFLLPKDELETFDKRLTDVSNGKLEATIISDVWVKL